MPGVRPRVVVARVLHHDHLPGEPTGVIAGARRRSQLRHRERRPLRVHRLPVDDELARRMVVVAHLVAVVVAEREPVAVVDHELVADGDAVVDRTADRGLISASPTAPMQYSRRPAAAPLVNVKLAPIMRIGSSTPSTTIAHRHVGAAGSGHRHHAADARAFDADRRRRARGR